MVKWFYSSTLFFNDFTSKVMGVKWSHGESKSINDFPDIPIPAN